jgi:hypothetical protein
MPIRPTVALALAVSLFGAARAQTTGEPRATIEAADGTISSRPLAELTVERMSELPAAFVRFEGLPPLARTVESTRELAELQLTGGDSLVARVAGGNGDVLALELPHGQKLEVDVDHLVSLVFRARVEPAQRGLLQPPEHGDRLLWVRPGGIDRVDGTLEAFGAEGPKFESVLGSRSFPWNDVAALYVESVGEKPRANAEVKRRVAVDLAAGGRLHGELRKLDAQGVRMAVLGTREIELPLRAIAEIAADDGSLRFLSELPPARAVEGWPPDDDLGMKWRYQIDRSVTGEPLRAGGVAWRRGIGVHAPSRLEWDLDGSWRTLRGSVAIDDSVSLLASRGSVQFRVFIGDAAAPAWSSGVVRGGDAPLALPQLALEGARKLALEVTMEADLYVADRADWLRVVLLRAAQ